MNTMLFFGLLGILVHAIFLYSVFDIYFKSPIIHGMTPHSTPLPAPAKRLVLFVADGLRSDKLFEVKENDETNSPFLRNIILSTGAWGVSHTRVPTESRPGHVALAAGIYEDVSAIAKGWKENPVEFDSVFNESRYTWAWGSPDIVPMFAKGSRGNVFMQAYSSSEEDFAAANPHQLDLWVFNKIENMFDDAATNSTLRKMLHEDKIIFFLHLLGMDISGHSYKPGSPEYAKNIQIVDAGIEKCFKLIESFYENDGNTAYIYTSDHGMTDWGSHGSGDIEETNTPLVAWGAGIRGPLGEGRDIYHNGFSHEWKLEKVKRVDVNQVDITPLIASLIGIPFPVNSLGILPVEYLGTNWPHKALSLLTNARQVLTHYQHKMREKKENTLSVFFWNFKELLPSRQAELMAMIDSLLKQNRYKDAIQVGMKLIEIALRGIAFYQRHDRVALSISVFLGFLGWMSYVIVLILRDFTPLSHSSLESFGKVPEDFSKARCIFSFMFIGISITTILYVQNVPSMYYAYFLLPVFFWMSASLKWNLVVSAKFYMQRRIHIYKLVSLAIFGFMALELLVVCFFKRNVISFILWAIASWPFFTEARSSHKMFCFAWCFNSIALSMFPLLPVVGRDSNYNLVTLAGWLMVLIVAFCARRPETALILNNRQSKREPQQVIVITAVQVIILSISTCVVQSTSYNIANKNGLPFLNQILSWLILASSLLLPLFGSQFLLTRLLNVVSSLLAPYLLLSISHEGLFCLFLCFQMFLWLCLEHKLSSNYSRLQDLQFRNSAIELASRCMARQLSFEDLRRAYFFLFFTLLAFFGTGNIASINSFEPSSVYCFLTVFNPFVMGFLLLLKVMIPFLVVGCAFRAIVVILNATPRVVFLLVLLMSDYMGLHFFFLVRDNGSWLEIGTSISHYIISMTTTIFIMFLYGIAWILTSCSLRFPTIKLKRHLL